jgi:hypothetical protein
MEVQKSEVSIPQMLDFEPLGITKLTNTDREKAFNAAVYPNIVELADRGAKFYEVPANEYLERLAEAVKFGNIEDIKKYHASAAVACQVGEHRSKSYKLLANDMGAPVAMTVEDQAQLKQQGGKVRVGMSYAVLGEYTKRGKVIDGRIVPDHFSAPIKTVIGFVDNPKELNDPEGFCAELKDLAERNKANRVNLDVVIVYGESVPVNEAIDRTRSRLKLPPRTN